MEKTEKIQFKIIPSIVIGDISTLYLHSRHETVEEAEAALKVLKEEDYSARDLTVLEAFEVVTIDEHLKYASMEDMHPFYLSKEEAIKHFNEDLQLTHIVEAVDTEGHTYECSVCGYHYYVFMPMLEFKNCTAERELILE